MRRGATLAMGVLALFITAGIVLQVFFAGLGIFGTEGFDTHEGWGWILHTVALVVFILSLVGPRTRRDVGMAFALAALMTVQILLSTSDTAAVAALHPTLALFVLGLAAHIGLRHRPGRPAPAPAG